MPHLAIVIEFDQSIQNTHVCVNVMEVVLYMITTFCALALNTTLFNLSSLLKIFQNHDCNNDNVLVIRRKIKI